MTWAATIWGPAKFAAIARRTGPRRSARSARTRRAPPGVGVGAVLVVAGLKHRVEGVGDPELLVRPRRQEGGHAGVFVRRGDEQIAHPLHRGALEIAQQPQQPQGVGAQAGRGDRRIGRVRRGSCPAPFERTRARRSPPFRATPVVVTAVEVLRGVIVGSPSSAGRRRRRGGWRSFAPYRNGHGYRSGHGRYVRDRSGVRSPARRARSRSDSRRSR